MCLQSYIKNKLGEEVAVKKMNFYLRLCVGQCGLVLHHLRDFSRSVLHDNKVLLQSGF